MRGLQPSPVPTSSDAPRPGLSIVMPAFNEEGNIEQAVRAAVGRAPAGLHEGDVVRFRPQDAQEGGVMKRPRPHLHVDRLLDQTAVLGPVALQLEDEILQVHGAAGERRRTVAGRSATGQAKPGP